MEADIFRRPLICRTSQSFFPRLRPLMLVLFPSECTDISGIVPGGPPLSLVMGVFPWKLNSRRIFLSHLLATANALSPQIRDRGLRNLPPLPRGVISNALDYGKLKHIWQLKWRKKGVARIIKKTMMMMTPPTRTRISPDGRRGRKLTMRPTTMQLMAMRTATKTMMTMPVTMVMTMVMTVAVID